MPQKQLFSSRLTTILTMIGVAVGLGNVWRFPYMMGKYGGSAFLLVYLLFTALFAIPAVMAELALGRKTRQGPIGAFEQVLGKPLGRIIGYLLIFVVAVANSYYLVVVGNVVFTTAFSIHTGFDSSSILRFHAQLGDGRLQYAVIMILLLLALFIIHRGLNKGIETVSKIFVPLFSAVIIYLVISAFRLEGAAAKFVVFLTPDFSVMSTENLFAALGQAFFSIGLGGTFLVIYGSYMQGKEHLPTIAVATAAGDVGAAVLASLFIVPTILVFGLDMSQGPTLIFETLPKLFSVMPGGRILGSAFLLALALVAFLSAVAALEVVIGGLQGIAGRNFRRRRLIYLIGVIEALLILPSVLHPEWIGILDLIFGSGMQVLGSVLAVIGVAWGLQKSSALTEIFKSPEAVGPRLYFFWIKWIVPAVLLVILVGYLYSLL